jgi:polysaccharide chain length determinant protein (PEP-CTERM system associated)
MNSLRQQVLFYWDRIWYRRWWIAGVAWIVCVVGWLAVSRIPDQYESMARVYMNSDQALKALLHGISVDDDVSGRVDRMQRTLLSATNMKKLIAMTDLGLAVRDPTDEERLIGHLQSAIAIKQQTSNLFTVTYRDPNPVLAQSVVSNLLSIFMESSEGDSRKDIGTAQRFVQTQLDRLEADLRAAEKKKSEFQQKYYDLLPSGSAGSALEQSRTAVQQLNDDLSDAIAQRSSLEREIALINPYDLAATTDSLPGRDQGLSLTPETRLGQLETQLEVARATMKPEHPVVVALQHQIDAVRAEIASKGRAGGKGPGQIANPLYRDMKMKLVDQDTKIASLRRRLETAEQNRDKMEAEARAAPGVGAEFINISRDYEVVKRNYDALLERRESARITEDEDKKGDKFDIRTIDAPEVPTIPVGPDRIMFVSLVLVAGIGAGVGLAFLMGELDTSFSNSRQLQNFGLPVIGTISFDQRFEKRKAHWYLGFQGFGVASLALFIAYAAMLVVILNRKWIGV